MTARPGMPQWMLSDGVLWMSQDTRAPSRGFRQCHCPLSCLKAEAPSLPEYPSDPETSTGSGVFRVGGKVAGYQVLFGHTLFGDLVRCLSTSSRTGKSQS